MLRSTGVGVFRSPFHFLYCQTYRGGLSIYRKFRVKISTRSAYLFGASIIRGAFGRHIGNFRRTFIFHCVALLSVYSLPGICSGGSFSNRPVGFVFRNWGTYQQRTPPLLPFLLGCCAPPVSCTPFSIWTAGQTSISGQPLQVFMGFAFFSLSQIALYFRS